MNFSIYDDWCSNSSKKRIGNWLNIEKDDGVGTDVRLTGDIEEWDVNCAQGQVKGEADEGKVKCESKSKN